MRVTARSMSILVLLTACPKSAERIKAFASDATPQTAEGVSADAGGWKIARAAPGSVHLFDVDAGLCDACFLLYRAEVKTEAVEGRAYLEMWVTVPGKGDFFSKGFDSALSGTEEWTAIEIPFRLEPGQKPEAVKLNLNIDGRGTAWIRNIELWQRPF